MNAADPRPLLVVNADDYGLTEKVSRGILDAHARGVITSTSVLSLTPAFAQSAKWLVDVPTLGAGVHFAAVGEDPPLLSAKEIPTLVDGNGRLWSSWKVFLPRAAMGRIDPDDLRREFEAQFDAITGAGVVVDHLDSHQNIHLWPMVSDVVLGIGEARGVRTIRVTRSNERGPIGITVRRLARRLERQLEERGWNCPEASTGLDEAGHLHTTDMITAIRRLSATGARSAELAAHPGLPDDPDRGPYMWDYMWDEEYAALISDEVRTTIDDCGFRLGTFADLAD